jgi:hypothetical protein
MLRIHFRKIGLTFFEQGPHSVGAVDSVIGSADARIEAMLTHQIRSRSVCAGPIVPAAGQRVSAV